MQIVNLSQVFDPTAFPKWEVGAQRCGDVCASYIFCQYWEYSTVYGCWIEDPDVKKVAYPLVRGPGTTTGQGDLSTASYVEAEFVKMGQYIQHICVEDTSPDLSFEMNMTGNKSVVAAP